MTDVRRLLDQVGGPNALTLPAWLVTLPLSVAISSVYVGTPTVEEVLTWTAILVGVHVIIGGLMAIAHATVLPSRPRRPRPATALGVFAGLGVARGVLLSGAQAAVGTGAFDVGERMIFNILATMLVYAVLAIAVDEYRTDVEIRTRLEQAEQALATLKAEEGDALREIDTRTLRGVQEQLAAALAEEGVDGARIRRLSESVVRELSHELAEPVPVTTMVTTARATASRLEALDHIVRRMRFPHPLAVMVPFEVAVFGTVAARHGVRFALANGVLGAIPTVVGLWLLRRHLPLPRAAFPRVVVIAATTAAVSAVATAANIWVVTAFVASFPASIPAVTAGVVGFTLVISGWVAAAEDRQARQSAMTDAVAEESREVARLQELVDHRRLAAARFLHGTVQNELVAASLRSDSPAELRSRITTVFSRYDADRGSPDPQADLERILASWGAVFEIAARIDPTCWTLLADDAARSSLLLDVVSEGFTNAVRHSAGRSLDLQVSTDGEEIVVTMSTLGTLAPRSSAGRGLRDLRDRGAAVEISGDEGRTTVLARLSGRASTVT